jgi:hypothetical protein
MRFNNEGTPLPPKPGVEQFMPDPRRDRPFLPTKGADRVDIFNGAPQARTNDRVRQHRADQFIEFHFRKTGRAPSEQEVADFLGEGDAA